MTLYIVPVLYSLIEGAREFLTRRRKVTTTEITKVVMEAAPENAEIKECKTKVLHS
jgi:hypothetical protein